MRLCLPFQRECQKGLSDDFLAIYDVDAFGRANCPKGRAINADALQIINGIAVVASLHGLNAGCLASHLSSQSEATASVSRTDGVEGCFSIIGEQRGLGGDGYQHVVLENGVGGSSLNGLPHDVAVLELSVRGGDL